MNNDKVLYNSAENRPPESTSAEDQLERLTQLADVEEEPLFSFKGVWPFDFFPNTITVYRNKVSIVKKEFFFIEKATNVPIESINYVTAHLYFPFASIEISDRYFTEQPIIVGNIRRSDADKAIKIIDGLRLAINQNIDLAKIPKDDLLQKVEKIGVTGSKSENT